MTVQEAIDHLQELVDCNPENANAEIRVATQPN
jgi:hypothetical protein